MSLKEINGMVCLVNKQVSLNCYLCNVGKNSCSGSPSAVWWNKNSAHYKTG